MIQFVLAALLVCASALSAFAQDLPWSQVTAAAQKGGVINIYHNLSPPSGDQWLAVFHDAFPNVSIESTRLGSGEMAHRVSTEIAAGVCQADVVVTLWDDTVAKWVTDGWMRIWMPPEAAAMPPGTNRLNAAFALGAQRSAILVNSSKVRPNDAPKDWADFLDPKWKGQIGMDPPWRSVAVQAMLALWEDLGIKDIARRLQANDVRFFNGSAGVLQAVIRGDVKVAPMLDGPVISALPDGIPVRLTYPASGIPAVPTVVLVPTAAPHPELGMAFTNWSQSAAGQQSYQDIVGPPAVRPGTKPSKLVPGNDQVKLVWSSTLLTPARQKAIIDEWRDVFGVK